MRCLWGVNGVVDANSAIAIERRGGREGGDGETLRVAVVVVAASFYSAFARTARWRAWSLPIIRRWTAALLAVFCCARSCFRQRVGEMPYSTGQPPHPPYPLCWALLGQPHHHNTPTLCSTCISERRLRRASCCELWRHTQSPFLQPRARLDEVGRVGKRRAFVRQNESYVGEQEALAIAHKRTK